MNLNISSPATDREQSVSAASDMLHTSFFAMILRYHIKMVRENNPFDADEDKLEDTDRLVQSLIKELDRKVPQHEGGEWMKQCPSSDKLFAIATMTEMIAKIGAQETDSYFEEFLGLVMGVIDAVFYAQKNRKKMYFPKYKKLIELIESELRADVNHQTGTAFPGQIQVRDGDLWFRTKALEVPSEIKGV